MAKTIEVLPTSSGLEKAAKWLERYEKSLDKKSNNLVDKLVESGQAYAHLNLKHIDTGATASSIRGQRKGNEGEISVGGAAVWIEFGTGVVKNSGDPHPKAVELSMSPWGTYVWYGNISGLPHGNSPNGWWYKGDDGEYHHTYGIAMNPFMYNTAQSLRRDCKETAREVFSDE